MANDKISDEKIQEWAERSHQELALAGHLAHEAEQREITKIEFKKMLDLSTGHMPNTSPDWGDITVSQFKYGFVVWVSEPETRSCPEWLLPIMKAAYEEGAILLLFDADAKVHPHWATYEW